MDENYAQKLALGDNSDLVKKLIEENSDDTEIQVERFADKEVETEEVDTEDVSVTDQFESNQLKEKNRDTPGDAGYVRDVAYARNTTEVSPKETEGFSRIQNSEEVKRLVGKVQKANKLVKECGLSRRYVVSKSDVPKNATVFKASEGYFYFQKKNDYRPSNVTEYADKEHWVAFDDDDERALFTVSFLQKKYPNALDTIDDKENMKKFLDRTLVDELDVVRDEDAFDRSFVSRLASLMT